MTAVGETTKLTRHKDHQIQRLKINLNALAFRGESLLHVPRIPDILWFDAPLL